MEEATTHNNQQGASQKLTQELEEAIQPQSQGASLVLTQVLEEAIQPQSQGASQELTQELEEAIHPQSQGASQEPDTSQSVEKQSFLAASPQSNQLQTKGLRGVPLGHRQLNHLSAENLQALDQPCKEDQSTAEQPSGRLCFRRDPICQYL